MLYGCETWSLALREVSTCDKDDELHNLYASPNVIRVIKSRRKGWAGTAARMGGVT
jgi:hypothetical protein